VLAKKVSVSKLLFPICYWVQIKKGSLSSKVRYMETKKQWLEEWYHLYLFLLET